MTFLMFTAVFLFIYIFLQAHSPMLKFWEREKDDANQSDIDLKFSQERRDSQPGVLLIP